VGQGPPYWLGRSAKVKEDDRRGHSRCAPADPLRLVTGNVMIVFNERRGENSVVGGGRFINT